MDSAFSSAGLGVLGGLMNTALGADLSYKKQKQLADYTDQLQRKFTKDQYQLRREGLEKAGYNPLLALEGAGAAGQEGIQLGAGNVGDGAGMAGAISGAINSAVANRQQKEMNEQTIKLQKEQIKNLQNQSSNRDISTLAEAIKDVSTGLGAGVGAVSAYQMMKQRRTTFNQEQLERLGKYPLFSNANNTSSASGLSKFWKFGKMVGKRFLPLAILGSFLGGKEAY